MQGTQQKKSHANLNNESVWFKAKLISQFLTLSFLLSQPFYLPYLHAAPIGGNVVGGTGSINQRALNTIINQTSQNLAINWQSFNVNVNEHVHFIQPNSSSIALNRILGNNGSVIQGQIEANGQVILVNPNGVFFTPTATVNVGGLIASGLDMTPSDFMNGNYIFNEVAGANGAVINSGLINASTGGNVALIGKQVKNEGLISAKLGSVVLAAGKQSVLTFDNQGLIGVKVTKEILQSEIGVDEAVINSGEINVAGGRVLLTASTSQDVFSQAVNNGSLNQATSVVVNADGSFILGSGADVLNTGSIDVSSEKNTDNTARIILLGENITSSGVIKADTKNGQAGEIEIHAKNKTLLIENSVTSAVALSTGKGGLIKVLGDKVGLFDNALVNASGVNGGGEILIGGDRQGLNTSIRNANFIYLGENTLVKADAIEAGDGGKIITFAKDTARIHGGIFARGGLISGNGGFIETSGLRGFNITNAPDVSAFNGAGGLWLIDPYNIQIVNAGATSNIDETPNVNPDTFTSNGDSAILNVSLIQDALLNGDVDVITGSPGNGPLAPTTNELGDISFDADLIFAFNGTNTLTLTADNNITFTNTSSITRDANATGSLNLVLEAGANVTLASETDVSTPVELKGINLEGGNLDINSGGTVSFDGGAISTNGGNLTITTTGNVTSTSATTNSITLAGGDFVVDDAVDFNSSNVSINVGAGSIDLDGGGNGVTGNVTLGDLTANGFNTSDLTITKATSISQSSTSTISIAQNTDLQASDTTNSIVLENTTNDFKNIKLQAAEVSIVDSNDVNITAGTNVSSLLKIKAAGNIADGGNITVSNTNKDAIAIFDTTIAGTTTTYGNVVLNNNNDFNNVKIVNANNVVLRDTTGSIAFEANDGVNSGGIRGTLNVTTTDNTTASDGNITDMGEVTIPGGGGTTYTGEINVGGNATFNIATARSLTLDSDNNSFDGAVAFNSYNHNNPAIANITFTDSTDLELGDIALTGDLIVKAERIKLRHLMIGGDLTLTTTGIPTTTDILAGSITQTTGQHVFFTTVGALATFNATGDITLTDSNNDFGRVTIINGGTVSLRDGDEITLLSSNTSNDLTIQAGGDISLAGDITTTTNVAATSADVRFIGDVRLATTTSTIDTSLSNGVVTFEGDVNNMVSGADPRNNLVISTNNGNVDFQGRIGVASTDSRAIGSVTVNSGVTNSTAIVDLGVVRTRETSSASSNSVDITAGTINLNGNIDTDYGSAGYARGVNLNGNVVLNSDIRIDTSAATGNGDLAITGTINSDTTSRNLIIDTNTGTVDLQGAIGATAALSALDINSAQTGGIVNLAAVNTNGDSGGANVINIKGSTINLNDDLISNANAVGGNILLTGNVQLNNDVAITSDAAGNTGNNGDVSIIGTINSDAAATARALTVNAFNNNISISGAIGNTAALQKVQFLTDSSSGTNIIIHAINTTDVTSTLNNTNSSTNIDTGVLLTAQSIDLGGNITSNTISGLGTEAGVVDINGAATLSNNVTINTNLANSTTADGAVDFSSTIQSTTPRSLSIDAGNANITVAGNIGGSNNELTGFTVINAGTTNVQAINTEAGGISISSNTINLAGTLDTRATNTAGVITLDATTSGNINLLTTGSGVTFNTNASVADANITITGSVNNTSSKDLTLDAGTADVSMTGTAGSNAVTGNVALQSLTVTGNNVSLGEVTSINAIDVTGNSNGIINLSGNLTTTGTSSNIALKQANVVLGGDVALQVAGANNIIVDGTINADLNTNNRLLSINAGAGTVDLQGDIGSSQAIQGLNVTSTGVVNVQSINTRSGGVTITSDTLNLSGNTIDTTDDATAAGVVNFTQNNLNLLANISINTNSVSGTDNSVSIIDVLPSTINANGNSILIDSGTGSININSQLTNLSSFTINNSGTTTLSGVETIDGTILVNAINGITLGGSYDSGAGDMGFYADSDGNYDGLLTLSSGAIFNGNNVTISGATLAANLNSITAADTLLFNGTSYVVVGDNTFNFGYKLDNTFLNLASANTLSITSTGTDRYVLFDNANLTTLSSTFNTNADRVYFYRSGSQFNNITATANVNMYFDTNVNATNSMSFTAPNLNMSQFTNSSPINLTSATSDIILNGNVTSFKDLNLNALSGTVNLDNTTYAGYAGSLTVNADIISHGNMTLTNSINLTSGSAYTQSGSLQSTGGNISIVATTGNIGLADITTSTGSISVNAQNGSIIDSNDSGGSPVTNITTGGTLTLTATGGIGNGNPLELNMNGPNARLVATNNGSGNIELANTGSFLLDTIKNNAAGGTFELVNTGGDVTINSLIIDRNNINSVAIFDISGGNLLGVQPPREDSNGDVVHLTANSAIFQMNNTGSVGQIGEPLITNIPNKIEVVTAIETYIEFFGQVPPKDFIGDNAYKNRALQAIENLSGQQLIQVESLAEIDPAIFTDVRNYSHSDIALMMPSDQRYTDDDEEEDQEAKEKRQKFLNSTP